MKRTKKPPHLANLVSRRGFMRAAAGSGATAFIGAGEARHLPAAAEASTASPLAPKSAGAIRTFRRIWAEHPELILRRSEAAHEQLAKSLQAKGAKPVTVGACQMANHCGGKAGKDLNLSRMVQAIEAAARDGVQVLAFPEMCLPGYFTRVDGTPAEGAQATRALADEVGQSAHLRRLQDAARQTKMVLAFGFAEKAGAAYYDAVGVVDADGRWLGCRRKNPLSPQPYETEVFTEPDPAMRSAVFKTEYGIIGISNCFDGEFPESIRRMRLAGAEVLLWCNAGTGNPKLGHTSRINACGSYAQANLMWVVCCNAVAGDCYGTSVIVGPSGEPLVILPTTEEALGIATINLALTANWDRYRQRLDPIWQQPTNR